MSRKDFRKGHFFFCTSLYRMNTNAELFNKACAEFHKLLWSHRTAECHTGMFSLYAMSQLPACITLSDQIYALSAGKRISNISMLTCSLLNINKNSVWSPESRAWQSVTPCRCERCSSSVCRSQGQWRKWCHLWSTKFLLYLSPPPP